MRLFGVLFLVGCGGGTVGEGDGVLDADEIPAVGWTGELVGTAHDVSGTAVIVDEDTIEIRDFVYDGGGINARMFLVVDGAPFDREIELTDNLVGSPSEGETMTLDLKGASFEDFDLLTLWCIPAGVSFGTAKFGPPE